MPKKLHNKSIDSGRGVTRRGFLATVGIGAVAVTGVKSVTAKSQSRVLEADKLSMISLTVNGRQHRLLVEPRWTLLFVIREKLGLTGTKVGCERGECGACTVLVNGKPQYACMILAVEAEGVNIITLEGLMKGEELGSVQQAFVETDAFQCGYCTPGQIVAAEGLLREIPNPSFEQIRRGMSGNLCRCGSYTNIFKAVARAAKLKGR